MSGRGAARLALAGLSLAGLLFANGELTIRYDLDLHFFPGDAHEPARIAGTNRVRIKNNWDRPLGELYLHNAANASTGEHRPVTPRTTIGNLRGTHLGKVARTDQVSVQVGLFPALNPGEEALLEIPFTTVIDRRASAFQPSVGSRGDTTIYNLLNFYPVLEFFHPDGWRPWSHRQEGNPFSNLAQYSVTLTAPAGFRVGASGRPVDCDTLTSDLLRWRFASDRSIAFSAVLSRQLISQERVVAGLPVEIRATSGQQVDSVFALLADLIPFYQERFGAYPGDRLVLAMGYSLDARAVGSADYIVLQDGFAAAEDVLPYEFAQQWFGASLLADESYETWLNESFAAYAADLFQEQHRPPEERSLFKSTAAVVQIWRDLENLTPEEITRRLYNLFGAAVVPPIYQPERQVDWENQAQVYSRYVVGSHALEMLQSAVGDQVMHDIMYTYATENRGCTVSTETFIAVVSRIASNRIGDNFRLALTTGLRPDYKIVDVSSRGRSDRRWDTRITTGFSGNWILPVDLEAITAAGDTLRFEHLRLQDSAEINLVTDSPVESVRLDPGRRIFDSNRFNNRWPRRFLLQPIYGLPDWEVYKLYYRPVLRQDWRDEWRTGVRVSGGLGLNLMPVLPAFYQNYFDLEVTFAPALERSRWGLGFTYRTPLGAVERTFWEFRTDWEYPRNEQTLSLSRYLGRTRYLVANRQSAYQRLTGRLRRTEFSTSDPNRRWAQGQQLAFQADFTRFRYDQRHRSNLRADLLAGQYLQTGGGTFYRTSTLGDLEQHLWQSIILRVHIETGLVWDNRPNDYLRYRLEHRLHAWHARTDFVPLFRGFTPVDEQRWDSVLGGGFSIGAETNLPVWPMIYVDGAVVEQGGGALGTRWAALRQSPCYAAAGIGIESQSLVELGLYLPVWISHPLNGGSRWGWRWLVQWGFYF